MASLSNDQLNELTNCQNVQDLMGYLADQGVELTDEQMEAVSGGVAEGLSLEGFLASFGQLFASIFPADFDPATLWGDLPTGGSH